MNEVVTTNESELVANNAAYFAEPARGQVSTSLDMSTEAGQDTVFDALTNAEPLADHLEEPIALKDIVFQGVELTSSETGEIVEATRTILIAEDGKGYATVSGTVIADLRTLVSIKGAPNTWAAPQNIMLKEVKSKSGRRFYKIERVKETPKTAKRR